MIYEEIKRNWHMRRPFVAALVLVTIGATAIAAPATSYWWLVPLLMPVVLVLGYIRLKFWPLLFGGNGSDPPDC